MNRYNLLLTLLVHQFTQDQYYRKHDIYVSKQKQWLEAIRKEPFDSLPKDRQTYYLDTWFWPPWRYNNIVGFAAIELETEWTIIGHLYLPEGRFTTARKKPLYLNFACTSSDFEQNNNESLQEAIIFIAEQLQSIVQERKWVLEFYPDMVKHTDFLAMLRERSQKIVE